MFEEKGVSFARRSQRQQVGPQTEIYLADTMGELGLFYRLCPVVCIGGSFAHVGGHNPVEAAQLGAAIIFGPHMYNFSAIAREFTARQAAIQLRNANEIAFTVERLLSSKGERVLCSSSARVLADGKRHVLDQVLEALAPWLGAAEKKAA